MAYDMASDFEASPSAKWSGIPLQPDLPGWHLLASKLEPGLEEVWHFDPTSKLPWTRRENGLRFGWESRDMLRTWDYIGLMQVRLKDQCPT